MADCVFATILGVIHQIIHHLLASLADPGAFWNLITPKLKVIGQSFRSISEIFSDTSVEMAICTPTTSPAWLSAVFVVVH